MNCTEKLGFNKIYENLDFANITDSLKKAFLLMDEELIKKYQAFPKSREFNNVGSTALVLLIIGKEIFVCSLGTSLGFICLNNGAKVQYLNRENSLQNKEERNRVISLVGCYK